MLLRELRQVQEELQQESHLLRGVHEDLAQSKRELEKLSLDRKAQDMALQELSAQVMAKEVHFAAAQKKIEKLQHDSSRLQEVEQALARATLELEQLKRESIKQLEAARTTVQEANSEQLHKFEELQKENELLLLHLHQVQEELEHYYLQNKDLLAKALRDTRLMQFFRDNQPAEVIIDLRGGFDGENWYDAEHDGRWAGPKTTSSVRIPALLPGQYGLEIDVVDAMSPEIVTEMDVYVNGVHVPTKVHMEGGYPALVVGGFSTDKIPSDAHWCFELRFKNLMCPMQRGESDERTLAVRAKTIGLILESTSGVQ